MTGKVSCVVPARLASNRFPGKMLHPLLGTPIVVHTLRRAQEAGCFDEILCLTDSHDIRDCVVDAGFRAEITGPAANGTERIGKYHDSIAHDLIVNLQGDEPVFSPQALRLICRALILDPGSVHVLVHDNPAGPDDLANPNRCKAGLDAQGLVLDFYRLAPHVDTGLLAESRLQMGAYGYGKAYVRKYASGAQSGLELSESHELLRDLGAAPMRAHICPFPSQAVDIPADAEAALALLQGGFRYGAAALAVKGGSAEGAVGDANMVIIRS
jgi:3-deoxy-manno-octulosonate cytidylyltransferase (CMP-KDO synthetase)